MTRLQLWREKFVQVWAACLTCMVGGDFSVVSINHAIKAAKTGSIAATVAVLCTMSVITAKLHKSDVGQAWLIGVVTSLVDITIHPTHYGAAYFEAAMTGAAAGMLALLMAKRASA